jgi:hypothetical protein
MAISLKRIAVQGFPGGGVLIGFFVGLSGTYPTGGETVVFSGLQVNLTGTPVFCSIVGQSGYVYEYAYGTDPDTGKLVARVNNTAGANSPLPEHTNAAYAAGVSGDTIRGLVWFK